MTLLLLKLSAEAMRITGVMIGRHIQTHRNIKSERETRETVSNLLRFVHYGTL